MIIKMQLENGMEHVGIDGVNCDSENVTEIWRGGWRFIDGLQNVECSSVNGEPSIPMDTYDETYLNIAHDVGFPTSAIVIAKRGDKEVIIASNLSVYLLNDSGKTIERLN